MLITRTDVLPVAHCLDCKHSIRYNVCLLIRAINNISIFCSSPIYHKAGRNVSLASVNHTQGLAEPPPRMQEGDTWQWALELHTARVWVPSSSILIDLQRQEGRGTWISYKPSRPLLIRPDPHKAPHSFREIWKQWNKKETSRGRHTSPNTCGPGQGQVTGNAHTDQLLPGSQKADNLVHILSS